MDSEVEFFITSKIPKSKIFTEVVPVVGEISLMFYIPYEFPQRQKLMKLIIDHGGAVVPYNNAIWYQIAPDTMIVKDEENLKKYYFNGRVYTHNLIIDSINRGWFKDPHDYIGFVIEGGKKIYDRNERRRYTIVEILKMSRIMKNQRPFGKKVWTYSDINNDIPERPAEGMRSTFKKYIKKMYIEEDFYNIYWKRERLDRFNESRWARWAIKDLIRIKARFWDYYMNPIRPHDDRCPFTNIKQLIEDDIKKENMNLPPSIIPIKIEKIEEIERELYWEEICNQKQNANTNEKHSKIAWKNNDEMWISQIQLDNPQYGDYYRRDSTSIRLEWDSLVPDSNRNSRLFKREEFFVTSECDPIDQFPNSQYDCLSFIENKNMKQEDRIAPQIISNEGGIFTKTINFRKPDIDLNEEDHLHSFDKIRATIKKEIIEQKSKLQTKILKEEYFDSPVYKKHTLKLFTSPVKRVDDVSKRESYERKRDSKCLSKIQFNGNEQTNLEGSIGRYDLIDQFLDNSYNDFLSFNESQLNLKVEEFTSESKAETNMKKPINIFKIEKIPRELNM